MEELVQIGKNAKQASKALAKLATHEKNMILNLCSEAIIQNIGFILDENKKDVDLAVSNGMKKSFIDRLILTHKRIKDMAQALTDVSLLADPIGEFISMRTLANGLVIGQKRVPIGVIGIIFEARPNVTADAFGLCLKSGSSLILRGGKEAILSNIAIVNTLRIALKKLNYNEDMVQLLEHTDRDTAHKLMKLNKYIDVLIPRGSSSLINSVIENSTIPVIQTGAGNCHIFVDETANFSMANDIIINAKTQRPGVCNACEKVLVHKNIASSFLPKICNSLKSQDVEIRGDERLKKLIPDINLATEQDWYTEYEDNIISIKVVEDIREAIDHIEKHSTRHSEAIITENYHNSQKFLNEVDSAAVYVNASTRFTDGFEFGYGAEIGISTQKLHARGPMGLKELTSAKYVIYGNGQVRQ